MLKLKRKGQSTAEYAIVIGLVIAAAVAMQVYVKRGIQGKVRDAVDNTLAATQYEPYYLSTTSDSSRAENTTAKTEKGGGVSRVINKDEASRTGTQDIGGVE
jgi:hypothetical protein